MRLVEKALLRAPLLPTRALFDDTVETPLFDEAIGVASPSLHAKPEPFAIARYRRRAAFRATPNGLLAGVAVVQLGSDPLRLGTPRARYDLAFATVAAAGREHLEGIGWKGARLRIAPSLLRSGSRLSWIAFGMHEAERRELASEPWLDQLLDRAADWTRATKLARHVERAVLLQLVDDGLLHHDLEPPLVGPPPSTWLRTRAPKLALPEGPTIATLLHDVRGCIAREPLERAAQLAPVLFALQDALAPPSRESELAGLDAPLERASAIVGEGLVPVAPLDLGDYGARVHASEPRRAKAEVVAWLNGLVLQAARQGRHSIELDLDALRSVAGEVRSDTFELHVTPSRTQPWLLGLHAPAGSTWGRFAHALGAPMSDALHELATVERAHDVLRLDVAYAPSRELADLCCVPPLREAALAISSWPEGGAVPLEACAIANDPMGAADRAVFLGDERVRISPLHRVRSATAPLSAARAVLGDSLRRQHAPWALSWGPLASLPWLPRLELDGFVVAPQSWAAPKNGVAAWRAESRVARFVQIGDEDVLFPLDLDREEDRALLVEMAPSRVYEIWPPLGDELDQSGHRVEIVCAVVDEDAKVAQPRLLPAEPPSLAPPDDAWRTIRLYASRDRHDALFQHAVAFAENKADAYFVLPYADERGEQLRVRLKGAPRLAQAFVATTMGKFMSDGTLTSTEIAPYHPERARYGKALHKVEHVFESDSRFVAEAIDSGIPDELLAVLSLEALAMGVTRTPDADALFARYEVETSQVHQALAPAYRALQRDLANVLGEMPAFAIAHTKRVRAAKPPIELLPTLLHLAAVRLCGPDRDREVRALYLWMRARKSRAARPAGSATRRHRAPKGAREARSSFQSS